MTADDEIRAAAERYRRSGESAATSPYYLRDQGGGFDYDRIQADAAVLARAYLAGRTYTATPPTESGWFWWRLPHCTSTVLKVVDWPGGGVAVHYPPVSEHTDGWTTPEKLGGEWCPIRPPG